MKIGTVEIGRSDCWEVKGADVIWVWRGGEIFVVRSDSMLMSCLIREWQESFGEEKFENGGGI